MTNPLKKPMAYNYPSHLLEQPYFHPPGMPIAPLCASMLVHGKFNSPLLALLEQLRADGHIIDGPYEEALALHRAVERTIHFTQMLESEFIEFRYGQNRVPED